MPAPAAFALRSTFIHTEQPHSFQICEDGFLICEDRRIAGVFTEIPDDFSGIPVVHHPNRLVIPGFCDLHVHAPQYTFRGMGMDLELLEWLEAYAFPEEAQYHSLEYAKSAYTNFVSELRRGFTTSACVFASIHVPATMILMQLLDNAGLRAFVGKVNMDRNSPNNYRESTRQSLEDTEQWIFDSVGRFSNVLPILTPRFIPSCTPELLEGLGQLQQQTHLNVQSHLSENLSEIKWVRKLCPHVPTYGHAYHEYGLFGCADEGKTIMAHCVYCPDAEIALMKERGVFIAHCPTSNSNLGSGIAPVRRYLNEGLQMGLGSDVAGGHTLSMPEVLRHAIAVSKLRWRLVEDSLQPLTLPEAFYLATKGGGAFFGDTGSFAVGNTFDALVLDDSAMPSPRSLTPVQRLERMLYSGDERCIYEKYVCGSKLF